MHTSKPAIHVYDGLCQNEIIELILQIQQQEFGVNITREDQPDLQNIPAFYQWGNGNFWYATVQGIMAGTISLLDIGQGEVALRKMFVKKEFRGSAIGVAQGLLEKALNWAKAKNVNTIFLGTTDKFIAAHRFYAKNGFEELPQELLPANFPVMKVDTRFYRLKLPASIQL